MDNAVPSAMNKSIWEVRVAETKSTTGEKHVGLGDHRFCSYEKGNDLHKYDSLRNRYTGMGGNTGSRGNGLGKVLLFMCEEKEALSKRWQMWEEENHKNVVREGLED